MSFNKHTTFLIDFKNNDFEVIDNDLIKTASVKLPDGFTYDPDYLYLKVKAVSAGEYWGSNKNDDYFPETELLKGYKTFLSAHTFKNHENKLIEKAIGDVLTADWSDKMKSVYLLIRIDRRIAPSIVRGFEKGFMTDVSMGCRVDHVVCSYCGKAAKTRFDYCEHLKTMKGKVMDNGKKVYEINIGPKFHDISAVLNGAERTAKVEGLIIEGSKVAFVSGKGLEKTASMIDSLEIEDIFKVATEKPYEELNMEVIASSFKEDKKSTPKDVDKVKTKIRDKALANACDEVSRDGLNMLENIVDVLKLNYSEYWDKAKCQDIGMKLRELSQMNKVPPEKVFSQFLKVLDFAAIELSPLEIHDIFFEVMNMDCHDLRQIPCSLGDKSIISNNNSITENLGMDMGIGHVMNVINAIKSECDSSGYGMFNNHPAAKIKLVIMKTRPQETSFNGDFLNHDIMDGIVSHLLESRSNHRKFAYPRLDKISRGEIEPKNNRNHFLPNILTKAASEEASDLTVPAIMSAMINSAYQNDRIKRANNGELNDGIMKIANYLDDNTFGFEKTAKLSTMKALMAGIPLTLSYSALQRSRINNGDQTSSFNRYIAENPTNAAFLYSMVTPAGIKAINKGSKGAGKLIKDISKKIPKQADDFDDNIFKNASIDSAMEDNGYSKKDISIIKYASVLIGVGNEDTAENILLEGNLKYQDMDEYLKTASSCFKIEIEKQASNFIRDIGDSMLGDVIFNNSKKGQLAGSIPGFLADGLIFAGIGKGIEKATNKINKTKKGEMLNVK